MSAELAGSKIYDRWVAAVSAAGDQADLADGTTPPLTLMAAVLASTSDNSFALAPPDEAAAAVTAAAGRDALGLPQPGCVVQASKFGTFLLPAGHAAALGSRSQQPRQQQQLEELPAA